jgi:RHH-type rel operon transcriptional repressor/antitoxin RelB
MMMAISVRLNEEDTILIKKYAELKKVSVSELIRQTILERIEDEYDLKAYEHAMKLHRENPITYSHEDVKQMLELD